MTSNLSRLRRDYTDSTIMFNLGERVLLYLSSHKVEDRVGIIPGVMMLGASLRPEDYCKNVHPDTTRKTPAWYGNAHDMGTGYSGRSTGT